MAAKTDPDGFGPFNHGQGPVENSEEYGHNLLPPTFPPPLPPPKNMVGTILAQ